MFSMISGATVESAPRTPPAVRQFLPPCQPPRGKPRARARARARERERARTDKHFPLTHSFPHTKVTSRCAAGWSAPATQEQGRTAVRISDCAQSNLHTNLKSGPQARDHRSEHADGDTGTPVHQLRPRAPGRMPLRWLSNRRVRRCVGRDDLGRGRADRLGAAGECQGAGRGCEHCGPVHRGGVTEGRGTGQGNFQVREITDAQGAQGAAARQQAVEGAEVLPQLPA